MYAEDAVDGVRGVSEGGVASLVAEAGGEVRTGAATTAVAADLGFLCSFISDYPEISGILISISSVCKCST